MDLKDSESVIVELDCELLKAIDSIREEWGIRSRADIIAYYVKFWLLI